MSEYKLERNLRILEKRNDGMTLAKIGEEEGLTRERIRQIVNAQRRRLEEGVDSTLDT